MIVFKAYKYRIYPTKEQKILLSKHFGSTRWVYNYALDKKIKFYEKYKKTLSRFDIQKELPLLKTLKETEWLNDVNAQSLQASLENMDKAFNGFFKQKKGFPKFKSKSDNNQSFSVPQRGRIHFNSNTLSIPKFTNKIKCRIHRRFTGKQKTVTITLKSTGKYYASVLVEENIDIVKKPICESQAVGIDLGIKTFAVISDGNYIENPRNLRKSLKKLKRLQRSVTNKIKGSKNRHKAILKLSLFHEKITNKRLDFLHKTTSKLISDYDTICLETLIVSNMIKNHKLSQAIQDVSIRKFNDILNYKAVLNGNNILRIGTFEPSSKTCNCGVVNKELKLSQRTWKCTHCNEVHDRDNLASNNIKKFAFLK